MDELRHVLNSLDVRLQNIEKGLVIKKITIPTDGYLVVKVLATDPVSPTANEIWINSTDKKLKWRDGGTTRYILDFIPVVVQPH